MSFDVADFLTSLFGDTAAAVAGPKLAPTPEALTTDTAPAPSGESDAGPDPFDGWVLRPDVSGRLGWEPPNLPESRRWWACCTDEELPTWDDLVRGRVTIRQWAGGALYVRNAPADRQGACPWCGRRDWWRSKAWPDVVRCGWCSPPAPGVAVVWLSRPESGPVGKSVAQEAGCCVPAGSADNLIPSGSAARSGPLRRSGGV